MCSYHAVAVPVRLETIVSQSFCSFRATFWSILFRIIKSWVVATSCSFSYHPRKSLTLTLRCWWGHQGCDTWTNYEVNWTPKGKWQTGAHKPFRKWWQWNFTLWEEQKLGSTPEISVYQGRAREVMSLDDWIMGSMGREALVHVLVYPLGHHIPHNWEATLMLIICSSTTCP